MLNEVFVLLRDKLNGHLSSISGVESAQTDQGQVAFVNCESSEKLELKLGAITLLLVNLEQEFALRTADPYRVQLADGTTQRTQPPIHLNLYLLFAARFKDYEQALRSLSLVLQFFQSHRVLDHNNAPGLSARVEKIVMELVTLPLGEVHNLWGMLRVPYQPSLLYKARLFVYQDEEGSAVPQVSDLQLRVRR
ncbi:MAG TPA: DUF4255 domain-containing protein [Pseudomonadota bacterium]|nr:DUF4255 domain-containing protein [Pseudomonadota bacterium]